MTREQCERALEAWLAHASEVLSGTVGNIGSFFDSKVEAGQLDPDAAEKCKIELQQQFDNVLERAGNIAAGAEQPLPNPIPAPETDEERRMLRLIRQLTLSIAKSVADLRPHLLQKYGLGERQTTLAITVALSLNMCFGAKLAMGASFDDCENLDAQILEMIRQANSKLGG